MRALGDLGMQAGPGTAAVLAEVLARDPIAANRSAAALGGLGAANATAADALIAALKDPDGRVRARAAETLG